MSAHQPAYLPWLGYLDKIDRADIFVFLDTVQFEKNSFINRNRIKTPQGEQWLTVPVKVKGHTTNQVSDILIDSSRDWRSKHLKSIAANYARSSQFKLEFPKIELLLGEKENLLTELCWSHLQYWVKTFGIATEIVRSSSLPFMGYKSELILNLCKHFDVNNYLSGPLGKQYLIDSEFEQSDIEIEYLDYDSPQYPQLWGNFIPNLSVVDFILNSRIRNTSSMVGEIYE